MMNLQSLAMGVALALPALASAADDGAVRRCRALLDSSARLACYDAMPVAGVAGAGVTAGDPSAAAPAPALAPVSSAVPVPAPVEPAAQAARVAGADSLANFGLPQQAEQTASISSRIPGRFEGWRPRERIVLANGQVWQIADDSRAAYWLQDPAVTVRRALFGGFVLEIEGVNQLPRVRRVQ